jgi:divalent metal cation (Fe/Co/Zn/Cd) transporter
MKRPMMDAQEKTMIIAILLSMFGPIVTGIALTMNTATTQLADFIRRTVEFVVLIISWQFYRYLSLQGVTYDRRKRLEKIVRFIVAIAILISGIVLFLILISKISNPTEPTGNISLGLVIAILGAIVNGFLWRRYIAFHDATPNAIIAAQSGLYQVKTVMDVFVILALIALPLFDYSMTSYVFDLIGTILIVTYLFYQSIRAFIGAQKKE